MSLTAPIKPTPPTVPQVKMQPVESGSHNTGSTENTQEKAAAEKPAEKPVVQNKAVVKQSADGQVNEPVSKNTTIINKVEQNDQNKIPLLNTILGAENVKNTAVTEVPPDSQNKAVASGLDFYAGAIVLVLLLGAAVWFFTRKRAVPKTIIAKEQIKKRKQARETREVPRAVFDYAADNTKEIIDLITKPVDVPDTVFQPPKKKTEKAPKEVKSNFEFRV